MNRERLHNLIRHPAFIPWCLLVLFTAIYFSGTVGVMNSVDAPDYALTQSMVDQHSTQLDRYPQWISPDYMALDHHTYDIRPPGLSILAMPSYALAKVFQSRAREPYAGQHPGVNAASQAEALTMMFPALCGALTIMLLYLLCLRFTGNTAASLITVFTVGLGTLLWKYSHDFIRSSLYTFLLVLLFYIFVALQPERRSWRWWAAFGVILGYTIVVESTAIFLVPIFAVIALYLVWRSEREPRDRRSMLLAFTAGAICSACILPLYELLSYHRLITDAYQYASHRQWMTPAALFSTPLFPSLFVNLFNNGGVPLTAFSPLIRNNPAIFNSDSAVWAMRTTYRGIFIQSPYLFAALLGSIWFARKFKLWAGLAFAIALITLVTMSKFVDFFNPNAFDTRQFLPMIPFLSIGLAFWWKAILDMSSRLLLKAALIGGTAFLTFRSLYNGWYSEITDYGPHVTGNQRFDLSQLQYPVLSGAHFFNDLGILFVNTFPNIYNIWMLAIYADIVLLVYLAYVEARSRMRRRQTVAPPFVTGGAGEGANPK